MEIGQRHEQYHLLWLWDPRSAMSIAGLLQLPCVRGGRAGGGADCPLCGTSLGASGKNLCASIREGEHTWEFSERPGTMTCEYRGHAMGGRKRRDAPTLDGSGDTLQLDRTVSGDLIDSGVNGGTLPVEGHPVQTLAFDKKRPLRSHAAVGERDLPAGGRGCAAPGLGDHL